jgi:hypothetical protein
MGYRQFAKKNSFLNSAIGIAAGGAVGYWLLPYVWHWGIAVGAGLVVASLITDQSW